MIWVLSILLLIAIARSIALGLEVRRLQEELDLAYEALYLREKSASELTALLRHEIHTLMQQRDDAYKSLELTLTHDNAR